MTRPDFIEGTRELADMLQLTEQEALKKAERYALLKNARYITDDGEVLSKHDYDRECELLSAELKSYIDRDGPLTLEGIGTFRLQQRSAEVYDVDAIDDVTFRRMKQLAILKVDGKLLKIHAAKGDLLAPKPMEITTSTALIIEKRR